MTTTNPTARPAAREDEMAATKRPTYTTAEPPTNATCPDCGRGLGKGMYLVVPRDDRLVRVCRSQGACGRRQNLRRTDPELFAELNPTVQPGG